MFLQKTIVTRIYTLLVLLISFGACNTDDIPDTHSIELGGIYKSEGYGFLFEAKKGKAYFYDITEINCSRNEPYDMDLSDLTVTVLGGDRVSIMLPNNETSYAFKKLDKMPDLCKDGGMQPTSNALVNFDVLWQNFKENYAFFDLREVDWDQAKSMYRAQVTEENLFEAFEEILTELNDGHVSLETDDDRSIESAQSYFYQKFLSEGGLDDYDAWVDTFKEEIYSILENYLHDEVATAANDRLMWGKINDKTGYVMISRMIQFSNSDDDEVNLQALRAGMDKVIKDFENVDKIIIDIRTNGGGYDAAALEIAGRFTKSSLTAYTKKAKFDNGFTEPNIIKLNPTGPIQLIKKVILLTSPATASAAEIFTMAMNQLPNVTIVGEHTEGVFSDVLTKTLPNGWSVGISNEVYADPSGVVFEKTGIPPDFQIAVFPKSDREAGKDGCIDKALSL